MINVIGQNPSILGFGDSAGFVWKQLIIIRDVFPRTFLKGMRLHVMRIWICEANVKIKKKSHSIIYLFIHSFIYFKNVVLLIKTASLTCEPL